MSERVYLRCKHTERDVDLVVPYAHASHAVPKDHKERCPCCGATGESFLVSGGGRRPSQDDRAWEADAACRACHAHLGVLVYETGTLFGVREDEAVLCGRWRVY